MEYLILALIVGAIWYYFNTKQQKPRETITQVDLPIKVTVSTSSGSSYTPERVDSGAITEISGGGFILNPKSPLPLTVSNLTKAQALTLKGYLDEEVNWTRKDYEITFLIAQSNAKCKEIDDYIKKYRPLYLSTIDGLKSKSTEWNTASEKDKEDLLVEFKLNALDSLPVKPSNIERLNILFEDAPSDFTADDKLLALFDGEEPELYRFYVSQLGYAGKVLNIPADDCYRKRYEKLLQKGLARRGQDIDMKDVLSSLRLKDINEALQGLIEKPLGRKAKAIDYALTIPDIKERLSKQVAFRELFQILEPEGFEVQEIKKCYEHANVISSLLRDTYVNGGSTLRTLKDADYDYWHILAEDCCMNCKPLHDKKTKRKPSKLPPFHIGCSCTIEGGYD